MSKNRANLFKSIRQSRDVEPPESELDQPALEEDVTQNPNHAHTASAHSTIEEATSVTPFPIEEATKLQPPTNPPPKRNAPEVAPQPKKRGRPATGKRSDPDWIGRTFYVKKETDLDVEGELFQLKRQGTEIDKSELVDSLLDAWVKWRNSSNSDFPIDKILPIQNSENS